MYTDVSSSRVSVIIGIATYKRLGMLQLLLESLETLEFRKCNAPTITAVVVDNDSEGSARSVCSAHTGGRIAVQYVIEPERGISFARNAVLREALGACDFLAFIDDDEIVTPEWLDELLAAQFQHASDVVAGPVTPMFIEPPQAWVVRGGYFNRARHRSGTRLSHVSTANVLIRSDALVRAGIAFDSRFALSGGGDVHFFSRLRLQGAVMIWSNEAVVREWIPTSRANVRWILMRALRQGVTEVYLDLLKMHPITAKGRRLGMGATRIIVGALALGPGILLLPFRGRAALIAPLRVIFRGVGMIRGVLGARYHEYRQVHGESYSANQVRLARKVDIVSPDEARDQRL